MAQGLVETTFEAGPNDELLAVDVYESGGSSVVNSYQKKDGGALDVLDNINGSDDPASSPDPSPAPAPASPPLSQTEVNRMLSNGSSELFGLLTDLSSAAASKFNINNKTINTITAIVNGVSKALNTSYSASDIKAIAGIVNVLSDGVYTNEVKDKKALDALVSSAVTTSAEIGLPNAFSKIAANPKHDKNVLAVAAKEAVQTTIEKGDASVFLDVVGTEFASGLETRYPSVIEDVITNVSKPVEITEQDYGNFYSNLTTGFTKVNDQWNKVTREENHVLFTDTSITNKFLNESLQSYIFSTPIDVKYSPDISYNNAVDVQFADIQIGAMFRAIYGATLDNEFISEKINEWLDPDTATLRQVRKDAWLTLVSQQFTKRSIEDDFKYHFPLEIPRLNNVITMS